MGHVAPINWIHRQEARRLFEVFSPPFKQLDRSAAFAVDLDYATTRDLRVGLVLKRRSIHRACERVPILPPQTVVAVRLPMAEGAQTAETRYVRFLERPEPQPIPGLCRCEHQGDSPLA